MRGERLFVPVEDRANRAVTDGMRRDLQPRSSANATTAVISSGSQFMWPLQKGLLASSSSFAGVAVVDVRFCPQPAYGGLRPANIG